MEIVVSNKASCPLSEQIAFMMSFMAEVEIITGID